MPQLFDRLNRELETFGRKAQAALDEGKLQIELLRLRRQQDNAARDLGLLIHRRERGRETDLRRIDALLFRLDDLEIHLGRLEADIAARRQARRDAPPTGEAPAPAAADGTSEAP
jgi:hypothetical protein